MSPIYSHKRDLRRSADLAAEDIEVIFELATVFKTALKRREPTPAMAGKSLAMIFEKQSLRTRCTFELGMAQLGGCAVYLSPQEIGLGKREAVRDIARNLERWFDIAIARTYEQKTVDELAQSCRIPIINALSDEEHPCQALADYYTLRERFGSVEGRRLAYIGDGNNICHSLIVIGAKLGARVAVSSPEGFGPRPECLREIEADLKRSGGSFRFEADPAQAVRDADAIYTDVWTSMGQEGEADRRREIFRPFQVNDALLSKAPKDAVVMHDLPAKRGEEITDEVLDGPRCIAFDQAENRLHAQKGVLAFLDGASE